MSLALSVLAALCAISGALFGLVSAIGLLRMPDLFTRLHAASKAGVLGTGLILLGTALAAADLATTLRAALSIAFLMLSTPVGAHLLARAALLSGQIPVTGQRSGQRPGRRSAKR